MKNFKKICQVLLLAAICCVYSLNARAADGYVGQKQLGGAKALGGGETVDVYQINGQEFYKDGKNWYYYSQDGSFSQIDKGNTQSQYKEYKAKIDKLEKMAQEKKSQDKSNSTKTDEETLKNIKNSGNSPVLPGYGIARFESNNIESFKPDNYVETMDAQMDRFKQKCAQKGGKYEDGKCITENQTKGDLPYAGGNGTQDQGAITGCSANTGLFSGLIQTGSEIFKGLRDLIYVVAGFGIIGVAVGGFFGNLNWKWLGAILIALVVIASTGEIINMITGCENFTSGMITDTLK